MSQIIPIPRVDVSVRPATTDDLAFIDSLQRENSKQLGFLALSWIENKMNAGQVLVAEEVVSCELLVASTGNAGSSPATSNSQPATRRVGHIISQDKYLKREELGLVVQLCVVKGMQRGLIGATLLKAAFERAAYGCRLFSCWCAQDLAANRFWEAMGFVPLAYRAGSEKKGRVHIFWQTRVRAGDVTTPWWFPSSTGAGAMRADRIVLPIPPGKHWSDEMPMILPAEELLVDSCQLLVEEKKKRRSRSALATSNSQPVTMPASRQYGAPGDEPEPKPAMPLLAEKPKREKKPRAKVDPKLIAAARELRDRYLEHVNDCGGLLPSGKYDAARALPAPLAPITPALLPAA